MTTETVDLSYWADSGHPPDYCKLKTDEMCRIYGDAVIGKAMLGMQRDLHKFWDEDLKVLRRAVFASLILALAFIATFVLTCFLDRPLWVWAASMAPSWIALLTFSSIKKLAQRQVRRRYSFIVEV